MADSRLYIEPRPEADLEWPDCAICGSSRAAKVYDCGALKIVRCRRCRLVYTRPRLKTKETDAVYDAEYWSGYEKAYEEDSTGIDAFAEKWLTALEAASDVASGRYLEVGAGMGMMALMAHRRGHEVYAVEPSDYAADHLRGRLGDDRVFQVHAEEIAELGLPGMDFVVMMAAVEHLHDPIGTLEQLNGALREGGLLLVSTGVWGSPNQRLARKAWTIVAPQEHLYYFSKKTLQRALEIAGFEVVELRTNSALINPLTESPRLVRLFNSDFMVRRGVPEWAERHRLGDEMWVIARKAGKPQGHATA